MSENPNLPQGVDDNSELETALGTDSNIDGGPQHATNVSDPELRKKAIGLLMGGTVPAEVAQSLKIKKARVVRWRKAEQARMAKSGESWPIEPPPQIVYAASLKKACLDEIAFGYAIAKVALDHALVPDTVKRWVKAAAAIEKEKCIPLTPTAWIEQNLLLTEENASALVPNVPPWILVWAVYRGGQDLQNLQPLLNYGTRKVVGADSTFDWFVELSNNLKKNNITLLNALESQWETLYYYVQTKLGPIKLMHEPTFAAIVSYEFLLSRDADLGCFSCYDRSMDLWRMLSIDELRRMLMDFIVEKKYELTNLSKGFLEKILYYINPVSIRYKNSNAVPRVIQVADGELWIDQEERENNSPAYLSRAKLPVIFRKAAKDNPPNFLSFLKQSISDDDIRTLQIWCGFVLLGINKYHKVLLIMGEAGSGKSTLIDIVEEIIGNNNVASLNIERLQDRFELGSFIDKHLLVAKDVSADALKSSAAFMLKTLSGDKNIKAELKFENKRVVLKGPFNIAITSNADLLIKLRGDHQAWDRRLLIINFDSVEQSKIRGTKPVTVANRDPRLLERILSIEKTDILKWMLVGARHVRMALDQKKQIEFPPSQEEKRRKLLGMSDDITAFVQTCVQRCPGKCLSSEELYEAYDSYCDKTRIYPMERELFYRQLTAPMDRLHDLSRTNVIDAKNKSRKGFNGICLI